MYNIAFFENGRFSTNVGGPVKTLPEALEQMKCLASGLKAEELPGYIGYKFDRGGTPCAIIVADRWGMPLVNVEEEE